MTILFLVLSVVLLVITGFTAYLIRDLRDFRYDHGQEKVGILLWILFGCAAFTSLKLGGLSAAAGAIIVLFVSAVGYFETEFAFLLRKFKGSGIS